MRWTFCLLFACLALAQEPTAHPAAIPAAAATATAPAAAPTVFSDQEWNAVQPSITPAADARPGWGTALSLLIGLVLVIAVALGLGWAVRRLNGRRLLGGSRGRHLEVLETVAVGPRRSLALVRCGATWLVVGLGEKEMIAVATMPAPVEPSPPVPAAAPVPAPVAPAAPSPFASELSRLLGRGPEPRP